MIKQRLLTALVLLTLLALSFSYLPLWTLKTLCSMMLTVALWEWCSFLLLEHTSSKLLYLITCILLTAWIACYIPIQWLLVTGVLVWAMMLIALIHFQHAPQIRYARWLTQLLGGIIVLCCWSSAMFLLDHHLLWKTWVGVAIVDSTAYAVGRCFGQHSLCRHISPNKTCEGLLGGVLGLVIVTQMLRPLSSTLPPVWIVVAAAIACVIGDLSISMLKRQHHMKDTGQLLPGHGGVLDRIDGLLATLPVIALWVVTSNNGLR